LWRIRYANMAQKSLLTVLIIATFAIAMGYLESAVVVYIREIYYPEGFGFPLKMMSERVMITELFREFATLVMLICIGILAGRSPLERFGFFIFAFGIWDIFYYVALNLLLGWPASLLTWDLLFLIPVSWLGPVLAPVINSLTMILMAILFIGRQEKGYYVRLGFSDWILIISGALVILYTYLVDYSRLLIDSGVLSAKGSPEAGERLVEMVTNYIPDHYKWPLFIVGETLILAATINVLIRSRKYSKDETVN